MCIHFVDFKSAFDTVHRDALWVLVIGIHPDIVSILKQLYGSMRASMKLNNGSLTDFFDVSVGVRQGCVLLPTLF